ncbi:hypothetical protein [Tuwongella immobilis]|uniref:Uncharacterized protein n=1 Tax=Tuwongella immobilis TaxID=692036 RepID=A0A6C2YHB8_9BACT|nr:hypothetical protein [Tuwongella immobilis]VIP00754.1 unnamed protein product [Tuwongella immobilis]VTR96926.1 unnamed protein product [Tuwongella immobilis]
MHWQDSPPHKAINFGAAFGLPDSPTMFRVSILRVPESDSLPTAFAEFWRRVLTEGPEQCSDAWTVLLVQMNLLGGGFTCVFTGTDLHGDEPPVFKFSSTALEAECYALPECEPGDPQWEADYQALEDRCLEQLVAATKLEPIAGYLAALRERRAFATIVCDFDRTKQWPLKL